MITEGTALPEEEDRARRIFARLGTRYGTRAQTALRFVLAEPAISTVVVGLEQPAHLEEALAAFTAGPLPPEALVELDQAYGTGPG
jgi:aryl-alcohol dehydrogenase-like predicted oxidoreductase